MVRAETYPVLMDAPFLESHLYDGHIRIVDATYFLPSDERNAKMEYLQHHIPGAVFFDIDACCDKEAGLPHMLPSSEAFAGYVSALGISNHHHVVVYDQSDCGLFSAARVWWMFRYFGHKDVSILNGGLKKWQHDADPIDADSPLELKALFECKAPLAKVASFEDVCRAVKENTAQCIDARSPDRFHGKIAEPRAGLLKGHIPGSRNIFFEELLQLDGTLRSTETLKMIFQQAGIRLDQPIIVSCGSGVTAAVVVLALHVLGAVDVSLYDGSAAEWLDPKKNAPITCEV